MTGGACCRGWCLVGGIGRVREIGEEKIDLAGLEAGDVDLVLEEARKLAELERQDLPIPACLLGQAVVSQDVGPLVHLGEVATGATSAPLAALAHGRPRRGRGRR